MKIENRKGMFGSRVTTINDISLIQKEILIEGDTIIQCITVSTAKDKIVGGFSTIVYKGNATKLFRKKHPHYKLLYYMPKNPTEEEKLLFNKIFTKEDIMNVHSIVVDIFVDGIKNNVDYMKISEIILKEMPHLSVRIEFTSPK